MDRKPLAVLLPYCQIPTTAFGTEVQEVIAARPLLGCRNIMVASTCDLALLDRLLPTWTSPWMCRLRALYPHDAAVLAGDFNAEHVA